jgi:hypothetical protein
MSWDTKRWGLDLTRQSQTGRFEKGGVLREGGRVRGVLLWNVWDQVPAARLLIAERGPLSAKELIGRLPKSGG